MLKNKVQEARGIIKEAFKLDPDLRFELIADIALLLQGKNYITKMNECNNAAEDIVDWIFDEGNKW